MSWWGWIYRDLSIPDSCAKLDFNPAVHVMLHASWANITLNGSSSIRGDAVAFVWARQHLLIRHPPAEGRFKDKWKAHGPAGSIFLKSCAIRHWIALFCVKWAGLDDKTQHYQSNSQQPVFQNRVRSPWILSSRIKPLPTSISTRHICQTMTMAIKAMEIKVGRWKKVSKNWSKAGCCFGKWLTPHNCLFG